MKKNSLTTAVVAGLAGVAGIANISNAVNLNPDGIGQVLVYPYYTVNGGNDTLISVVNTTNTGKAVKVRFLEGRNSREVLDFNLYLSEFDVWTAGIFGLTATGEGNLTTADNSCTVPGIKASVAVSLPTLPNGQRYVPFRNFQYTGVAPLDDAGPNTLDRTREGYIEMIEMGTLINNSASDKAATHVGGVPQSCPTLEGAWGPGGYWTADSTTDMLPPSGGIYGGGAIVNVSNGTYINYNADALERFSVITQHTNPGNVLPNLETGITCATLAGCPSAAGPIVPVGGMESIVFDNGQLIVSAWDNGRGEDAVSAVFAYDNLINEYTVETGLRARSEWVATFPTKRFYVDPFFIGGNNTTPTGGIPPFTSRFAGPEGSGQACERINIAAYNREEARPTGNIDFSPLPPEGFTALCFEAQVITFNQTGTGASQILGATYARNIATQFGGSLFENGWVNIGLSGNQHRSRASLDGDQFDGLPVTGFWALTVENQNAAPGVRGFYGGAFRHRGTRECIGTGGGLCAN